MSIRDIRFKENHIEIDFVKCEDSKTLRYGLFVKTIIIPKLYGYSLIIN